jgi:hypothetical protein
VPIGKTKWSVVACDEPFFNLNTVNNGPRGGFNQNWLFLGINRRFNNHLNAEVGYLNNYVSIVPVQDEARHYVRYERYCQLAGFQYASG